MWQEYQFLPVAPGLAFGVTLIVIWSLAWKGLAMWRAARHGHQAWFIVFLIVNTAGILEIIYLLTKGKHRK